MTVSLNCQYRRGFTLVEVTMVILIVSIMSSVVLPTTTGFYASEQASAAASILTADVRMARFRAMEFQGYVRIKFLTDNSGWRVEELCDSVTHEAVTGEPCLPTHTEWQSIIGDETRDLDTSITIVFNPDPPPWIYFRPDGLLVTAPQFDAAPLGILKVIFTYTDNETADGAEIEINPAGVIESKAYYREDI